MKLDLPLTRETEKTFHVHMGQNIRTIRKRRKISMEELGSCLGISYQQYQKYETGENRLSVAKLMAIAAVLDVCEFDLLKLEQTDLHALRCAKMNNIIEMLPSLSDQVLMIIEMLCSSRS